MREYARYEEQEWRPERSSTDYVTGNAFVWLLVGIGVGAGAALLLTPKSGSDLRNAIARGCRRTFNGISDGISRGTQELRAHGSNLLNFNRSRSEEQRSQQG